MRCEDLDELIEAVAAGDPVPAEAERSRRALAQAARRASISRARWSDCSWREKYPTPPARFTLQVMRRVSQERWRVEQFVDAGFNLALARGRARRPRRRRGAALVARVVLDRCRGAHDRDRDGRAVDCPSDVGSANAGPGRGAALVGARALVVDGRRRRSVAVGLVRGSTEESTEGLRREGAPRKSRCRIPRASIPEVGGREATAAPAPPSLLPSTLRHVSRAVSRQRRRVLRPCRARAPRNRPAVLTDENPDLIGSWLRVRDRWGWCSAGSTVGARPCPWTAPITTGDVRDRQFNPRGGNGTKAGADLDRVSAGDGRDADLPQSHRLQRPVPGQPRRRVQRPARPLPEPGICRGAARRSRRGASRAPGAAVAGIVRRR